MERLEIRFILGHQESWTANELQALAACTLFDGGVERFYPL